MSLRSCASVRSIKPPRVSPGASWRRAPRFAQPRARLASDEFPPAVRDAVLQRLARSHHASPLSLAAELQLPVRAADCALRALALDTGARLEVGDKPGDHVLYIFDRSVARLRLKLAFAILSEVVSRTAGPLRSVAVLVVAAAHLPALTVLLPYSLDALLGSSSFVVSTISQFIAPCLLLWPRLQPLLGPASSTRLQLHPSTSYTWTLRNVSAETFSSLLVGTCVSSPSFRACGRTWQLELYPNGDRESSSSNVSLFLRLVTPRYLLPRSPLQTAVRATYSLALASVESFNKDTSFDPSSSTAWGSRGIVSHAQLLASPRASFPGGVMPITATIQESGFADTARAPLPRLAALTAGASSASAARRRAREEQELRSLRSHPRGDGASDASAAAPRLVSTLELARLSDVLAGGGGAPTALCDEPEARAALRAAVVLAAAAVVVAGGGGGPPRIAWRLPEAGAGEPSATVLGRPPVAAAWWEEEEEEDVGAGALRAAATAAAFAAASLACVALWAAGGAPLGVPPLLRGLFSCPLLVSHPLLRSLPLAAPRLILSYAALCALPAARWAAGAVAAAVVRAVLGARAKRRGRVADDDAAPAVDVLCGGYDGSLRAGSVDWSGVELERLAAAEFAARLAQPCA